MSRILIIDDRPVNRQFLTTLLGYQQHELREASDGAEGLRQAREFHPDLIISDVLMPTMDGYEFVRRLREEPEIGKTTVIFSTAHYLSRESQALAEKSGITRIIYKPCEPQAVLDLVSAALAGRVPAEPPTPPVTEELERDHLQLLTNKLAEKTEQLRDAHGKLTALIELSTELASERDPAELLDRYCSVAREVIGACWTLVVLLDRDHQSVHHLGFVGIDLEDSPRLRSELLETGVFRTAISEGRTICLSDVTSTPGALHLPKILPRTASLLVVPLARRGQSYGWICLADKLGLDAFSEQDEQLTTALAAKMAVAYDNAILYRDGMKYAGKLEAEIAERAKAERELSESKARLAGIIGSAMDAIVTIDANQRVMMFNEAAEKMFRCAAAETIGQPIDAFIPERFRAHHSSHIEAFGKTGVTTRGMALARTVYGLRADGEEFPLEASISQIEVQGEKLYTVIMRDITERVRAWERFTQVIERAPNGMVMVDAQGRITMVNSQMEQLFGYDRADLLGKPIEILVPFRFHGHHGADREQFMQRPAARPMGAGRDLFGRRKDGSEIPVEIGLNPIQTDQGMMVLGTVVDITERKQAEAALRASEEQFRTMANSIPQLAWMAHADGYVFWYNQRWHDYTGKTPAEMEGWGWQSVHDPEVLPQVMKRWQDAIATGQPVEMEFPLLGANGKFRTFLTRVHPLKDSQGRVVQWFGTNTDVDEMKVMEAALRKSEASLRESQHIAHLGSYEFDAINGTWKSSEELDKLLGIDKRYDRSMAGWLALIHPADRVLMDDYTSGAGGKWDQVFEIEYRVIRQTDQAVRWLWTRASVERDSAGRVLRIRGTTQDTTERKQAEAALRSKSEELASMTQQLWQSSKLATMGELSASIAHELNNPLATVTLRAENLLDQLPAGNGHRPSLEVILKEVERMAGLVSNLLQFSRRSHRQVSTVDVREEIANSIEFVHYHLRNRKIEVVRADEDPLPTIQADRQQLRQLFLNLLTNASDAMPQGGRITISTKRTALEGECAVAIDFSDSGEGISAANLEKIWEPFFTTKAEGKGTGLGLAICRRIVEEHNGSIAIESPPGSGAVVHLVFAATTDVKAWEQI